MNPSPPPASHSAGVRVDPQLLYAIPLAVGLLIDRWHPLRIVPPPLAVPVGIASLVVGVAVCYAAARRLRAARTTLQPWEPTTTLVTDGPFRRSRNPIYVGYTLLYLGVAVWVNSAWPLALWPVVLWLMHRLVIAREEAYLGGRFGETYRAYKRRVRRWL